MRETTQGLKVITTRRALMLRPGALRILSECLAAASLASREGSKKLRNAALSRDAPPAQPHRLDHSERI